MASRTAESSAELRRRMLNIARLDGPRYPNAAVPAKNFLRATDDSGDLVEGEGECAALLDDLVEWGLLHEVTGHDLGGAARTFAHRRFSLTKKGFALWMQEIDPIPGVADSRFED